MATPTYTIEIKNGLKANLPGSDTHIGQPYFCTDTNELFIWDGTAMALVGGITLAQVAALAIALG
jgi:hypothetical protein